MKKLLIIIGALIIFMPTAFAQDDTYNAYIEFPTKLYSAQATMTLSDEQSPEDILYPRIEAGILAYSPDGALQTKIGISVKDCNVASGIIENSAAQLTIDDLLNIYSSVVYNHPEIGNLITGFNFAIISDESSAKYGLVDYIVPQFRPIYDESVYNNIQTAAEREEYLNSTHNVDAYNDAINYAFSKAVSPDMTEDWQKLLSIHDYLADTITYNPIFTGDYTSNVQTAYNEDTNYLSLTPYAALVGDRKAICQGYALAFKLLCNMAGIECGYAVSSNHIWNIVALGDNYYHIDVTWDDPSKVSISGTYTCTSPHVAHRFFLRSDSDSTALHNCSWTTDMPACTDSTLFTTLEYNNITSCLRWADGTFWYEVYKYVRDSVTNAAYYVPSGVYRKMTDSGFVSVSKEDYLPAHRLSASMYNVFSSDEAHYIAIDGTANTNADFYAAETDSDGNLLSLQKYDITFNDYGEAVAKFNGNWSKLLLFSDDGIKPLAYAKQ